MLFAKPGTYEPCGLFSIEHIILIILTIIGIIISLIILVPSISVTVRRLHDTGKPWTYMLVGLIPFIGIILLIVQYCQPSAFDNRWGPAPKK